MYRKQNGGKICILSGAGPASEENIQERNLQYYKNCLREHTNSTTKDKDKSPTMLKCQPFDITNQDNKMREMRKFSFNRRFFEATKPTAESLHPTARGVSFC